MNFLAHAYLSGNEEDILIGNFIADAVKGNSISRLSEGIQKGVRLHREIDSFTDQHPVFIRSKKRIQDSYGKFSGVVIDIYYDHFLASSWSSYSDNELSEFALYVYNLIFENYSVLPSKSRRILPYMAIHNWLVGYSSFRDLQWVFDGMSRRSRQYNSRMESAVESLKEDYGSFEKDFIEFFPDMIAHAGEFRKTL
jgi:acyl carrier protein phosphodiesterase